MNDVCILPYTYTIIISFNIQVSMARVKKEKKYDRFRRLYVPKWRKRMDI